MKNKFSIKYSFSRILIVLFVLAQLLSACKEEILAKPTIVPARTCQLSPNESIPLAVTGVEGEGIIYEWSTSGGTITPPTGSTVNFTAPDNLKQVIITVKATNNNGKTSDNTLICNIEIVPTSTSTVTPSPLPTDTPFPTETPTSTPIPEPISCQNPSIITNVFPWFNDNDVDLRFSFYGPTDENRFLCEGVYDISYNTPLAVHIKFDKFENNFGFWGVGVKAESTDGFDITSYSEICFWVYAKTPGQAFRLKLREIGKSDKGIPVTVEEVNQWQQVCTDLTKFSDQGVALNRLQNVNLGFESDIDSAEVWVDSFEFK